MSRQVSRISSIATLLAALLSCGPAIPAYREARLPSGRTVKVMSIRDVQLEGSVAGLWLVYETDLTLDDRIELYREVEAIWDEFRFTEEVAGKSVVVIKATTPEARGWSRERASVKYTIQLGPEGSWHFANSGYERTRS